MTAIAPDLQSLAQLSAERMLNSMVLGTGIALLAWILLRALGRQNSGTRFAVWFAALLGIAMIPAFGNWHSGGSGLAKPSAITIPGSWALYIFSGWLVLAGLGLIRLGVGFWRLRHVRKTSVSVDFSAFDPALRATLRALDSRRAVRLCVSDELRVPTAIGVTKPLIVIPSWALQDLNPTELNAVLLHELAHLRRWDDWTNLVQKIVAALFFFHPAVWWIEKKLELEREMACDDLVLANSAHPRAYAECLVSMAEKTFLRRGLSLAQAVIDRGRHISLRVSQILDVNRPSATRVWRPAPLLLAACSSLVCLVVLSYAPRLVSFENDAVTAGYSARSDISQVGLVDSGARIIPARLEVKPAALASVAIKRRAARAPQATKSAAPTAPLLRSRKSWNTTVDAQLQPSSTAEAGEDIATFTLIQIVRTEAVRTRFMEVRHPETPSDVVLNLCIWRVTIVRRASDERMQENTAKSI
jgi:Zn-dependent protease with chaperone function